MVDHMQDDPNAIERDIERTQREMSETVDQLSDQMTPRRILDSILDKTETGDLDSRELLDQAKRNPIALAMIGGGLLWLISGKDARPSALTPSGNGMSFGSDDSNGDSSDWDVHDRYHRGYVDHMSQVEPDDGEDHVSYLGRRNRARANYLMLEQRHDEDDTSFRDRLDEATEKMRDHRANLADRASKASSSAARKARSASDSAKQAFSDNPLIGGFIAAAIGAIAGSTVPLSRTEQQKLGDAGEAVIDQTKGKVQEAAGNLQDKKDEMVEKADRKIEQA